MTTLHEPAFSGSYVMDWYRTSQIHHIWYQKTNYAYASSILSNH